MLSREIPYTFLIGWLQEHEENNKPYGVRYWIVQHIKSECSLVLMPHVLYLFLSYWAENCCRLIRFTLRIVLVTCIG